MLCCFFFAVWIRNESWWQDAGPQLEKGSVCITVLFVNPALSIFEDSLQNLKETKSLVHSLNSAPFIIAMQPLYHFVRLQYPEFSLVQSHSWSFFLVPVPSVIFFEHISVIQWITWDWSTAHADIKLNKHRQVWKPNGAGLPLSRVPHHILERRQKNVFLPGFEWHLLT